MNEIREVTVWMWACPHHGVQPVHWMRKGTRKRLCGCGAELYETLECETNGQEGLTLERLAQPVGRSSLPSPPEAEER